MRKNEQAFFFLHLSLIMKSGKTLAESLSVNSLASRTPVFASALQALSSDAESGIPLYRSLEKFPELFDKDTIAFVKTLETHHGIDAQGLLVVSNWLSGIGRITELFTRFFRTLLVHLGLMELILAFLLFLFIFVMPHFLADYIPLLNEVGLQFDRRFIPMCMSWLTNFMVNYKVIIVPLYFLIIVSLYFLIVGSPLFLQRRSNKDIFLLLSIIRKIPLLKKYAISAELAITSNIFISLVDGKILAEELFIDMSPNADIAQVIYKGYQKKVENNAIDTENLEIEFNLSSIDAFETTFKKMMFTTEVLTEVLIVASSVIMVILILISLFMPKFGF